MKVFFEVIDYDYMDKSCLLLIVFCIIWQQGRKINDQNMNHGVGNSNKVLGARIFMASSLGMSVVVVYQVKF